MDIGNPVVSANSIDIPVTPPSIKWLESKKPFNPMPADRIPSVINNKFLKWAFILDSKIAVTF